MTGIAIEELEINLANESIALSYFIRATKDCSNRCNVLKIDQDFNDDDKDCLSLINY